MTAFFHIVNLLFQFTTLLFQSSTFTLSPYYRERLSSYPIPCFYRNLCPKGMDVTGWAGNFRGVPSFRSPMAFLPPKKTVKTCQSFLHSPFFHNDFLMARFRPIGHPERRNLPVRGKDPGSRDSEPRELLPPCTPYHGGVRFLRSASVKMTGREASFLSFEE